MYQQLPLASIASANTLIVSLKAQDSSAFDMLYNSYSKCLHTHILNMVRHKDTADDLLQEVFLKVWRCMQLYDPQKGCLYTWMAKITHRICIDYIRSTANCKRKRTVEEAFALAVVHPDNHTGIILLPDLKGHVLRLEKKLRNVIVLSYYHGFTNEQVALLLDIPVGTVKTRRRAGLQELRNFYN